MVGWYIAVDITGFILVSDNRDSVNENTGENVYWRILWLVPVSVTIPVAFCLLLKSMKGGARFAVFLILSAVIVLGGKKSSPQNGSSLPPTCGRCRRMWWLSAISLPGNDACAGL